jgi:AraC-like DNA-binding protein
MPQTFYALERLGLPFYRLVEQAMVIPAQGKKILNGRRKIVLVLGGSCRHRFSDGPSQILSTGDVLIVPRHTSQVYESLERRQVSRLHTLLIDFDPDTLPLLENDQAAPLNAAITDPAVAEAVEFLERRFQRNEHIAGVLDAAVMEIVAQIRQEAELHLPGSLWRITALCTSYVVQLARSIDHSEFPEQPHISATQGIFLVNRAKEYLMQHLAVEVHLDDVAEHLGVSRGHLARTYKRVAGRSLFAYFRQLRLEQAKLMLINSENNVTQIAAECGFSSVALFCRNFKQYTDLSPLAYRDEFGTKTGL